VLVQDHPVVLETQPAGNLGVGSIGAGRFSAPGQGIELLGELVRIGDVALVQLEVHLERLIRDAAQPSEMELLRRVDAGRCGGHLNLPVILEFRLVGLRFKSNCCAALNSSRRTDEIFMTPAARS